ncbi:hypothetical protein GGX14DRAFT_375999 [Mycena pura]|uniref:Uncharacterized protein n=1 Tax=Mycena pura TaxID=153505 RepID=A0AAD6Y8P5_9AGAR|nr:hypothetical protein GGX14DRAFT_375999 [Mycena pura]
MLVVWNGARFYIGEIRDVFKKGANSRHGSVPGATSVSGLSYLSLRVYLPLTSESDSDSDADQDLGNAVAPLFSCNYKGSEIRLQTHAKVDHVLFNLGPRHHVFENAGLGIQHRKLKSQAAKGWISLTTRGTVSTAVRKVTLKLGKAPEDP